MASEILEKQVVMTDDQGHYLVSAEWVKGVGYVASATTIVGYKADGLPVLLNTAKRTEVIVAGKAANKALRTKAEEKLEEVIFRLLDKCATFKKTDRKSLRRRNRRKADTTELPIASLMPIAALPC